MGNIQHFACRLTTLPYYPGHGLMTLRFSRYQAMRWTAISTTGSPMSIPFIPGPTELIITSLFMHSKIRISRLMAIYWQSRQGIRSRYIGPNSGKDYTSSRTGLLKCFISFSHITGEFMKMVHCNMTSWRNDTLAMSTLSLSDAQKCLCWQ